MHSILFYSILFYSILFYSILFYSILFYQNAFYLECVLTRNERRDEKGFLGIDSHLRGDRDKSTSSVISLNLNIQDHGKIQDQS
jgi:hypothetical protein